MGNTTITHYVYTKSNENDGNGSDKKYTFTCIIAVATIEWNETVCRTESNQHLFDKPFRFIGIYLKFSRSKSIHLELIYFWDSMIQFRRKSYEIPHRWNINIYLCFWPKTPKNANNLINFRKIHNLLYEKNKSKWINKHVNWHAISGNATVQCTHTLIYG